MGHVGLALVFLTGSLQRDAERKEMRERAYPESLTAYSAIIATKSGQLWVREPDLTGAPGCWCLSGIPTVRSAWSVFDASGQWLGDVSMPPRFVPLEIGEDYVLVVRASRTSYRGS
jgi:hypothetical protein